ncbi:MAG: ribosome maturation factor RimP [Deltaproteobacteria bacterium]|nr:ribosome maturation factor RimP [Deltaproteobacteria bacterium]
MHENLINDLERIIEDIVPYYGCYLVGAVFFPAKKNSGVILRVYVDSEKGVDISVLSEISKEIGMILDVKDIIKFKYTLEVSSPGVNRVLIKFNDYEKFIGKRAKIVLKNKTEGRINLIGEIAEVSDGDKNKKVSILDEIENKIVKVDFYDIKKGNLLVV